MKMIPREHDGCVKLVGAFLNHPELDEAIDTDTNVKVVKNNTMDRMKGRFVAICPLLLSIMITRVSLV